jgi:hypothetical protein
MTRILAFLAILLANLLIGGAFLLQQAWGGALACLVLAGFWMLFILVRKLKQLSLLTSACFLILSALAALCLAGGASPFMPFLGFGVGLAAWDLSDFGLRLDRIVPPAAASRLEKLHLTRLAYTVGLGFLVGMLGLIVHFQLNFIPAFILAVLAFFALAVAVRRLVKKDLNQS